MDRGRAGELPADVAKLRKLLLSLSDAKIREEKTSDPAKYSISVLRTDQTGRNGRTNRIACETGQARSNRPASRSTKVTSSGVLAKRVAM